MQTLVWFTFVLFYCLLFYDLNLSSCAHYWLKLLFNYLYFLFILAQFTTTAAAATFHTINRPRHSRGPWTSRVWTQSDGYGAQVRSATAATEADWTIATTTAAAATTTTTIWPPTTRWTPNSYNPAFYLVNFVRCNFWPVNLMYHIIIWQLCLSLFQHVSSWLNQFRSFIQSKFKQINRLIKSGKIRQMSSTVEPKMQILQQS